MSLRELRHHTPGAPALVDEAGRTVSYATLDELVATAARALAQGGSRLMGLLSFRNHLAGVVAYLACLRSGHVPLLLPAGLSTELKRVLVETYQPDWLMDEGEAGDPLPGSGLPVAWRAGERTGRLHPDLGLLLSTSGTTGSARVVRLSYSALDANASSIARFLELTPHERAITTLPPHYSYGLSVINSHLHAGACVVLTDLGVLQPAFWDRFMAHEATSLAGVPYTYQILHRTGFGKRALPSLRTMTQAGGRLDDRLMRTMQELAQERGWRFFVMYGQTEATARMSYVPPQRLSQKIGSIGVAIPGGELSLDAATGELIYRGPNAMMGYAESRDDLARGDELHGVLRTGELGRQDDDGYFFLTGRLRRFVKLGGNRIGLDEVENLLQTQLGVAVSVGGRDDRLLAWIETADASLRDRAAAIFRERYGIHHSLYRLALVDSLPLLSSGKKDYSALREAT